MGRIGPPLSSDLELDTATIQQSTQSGGWPLPPEALAGLATLCRERADELVTIADNVSATLKRRPLSGDGEGLRPAPFLPQRLNDNTP